MTVDPKKNSAVQKTRPFNGPGETTVSSMTNVDCNGALYSDNKRHNAGFEKIEGGLTCRDITLRDPQDLGSVDLYLGDVLTEELAYYTNRNPEKPLVILIGEFHTVPSHVLSQISAVNHVCNILQGSDDTVLFVEERSANFLDNELERTGLLPSEQIEILQMAMPHKSLSAYDKNGRMSLISMMARNADPDYSRRLPYAPVSNNCLYHYLAENEIPYHANDTFRLQDQFVDPSDPSIRKAYEKFPILKDKMIDPDTGYDCESPEGLALRNAAMASRALQKAYETGASVLIQKTGILHIFGGVYDQIWHDYDVSLSQIFKNAGCHVLPVIFPTSDFAPDTDIEAYAFETNPRSVICRNFSSQHASASKPSEEIDLIQSLKDTFTQQTCAVPDPATLACHDQLRQWLSDYSRKVTENISQGTEEKMSGTFDPGLQSGPDFE